MSANPSYPTKINSEHRRRKAVVYLRQSSMKQVRHNLESQHLQYGLVDRARSLGWSDVETMDVDLGKSASIGSRSRPGFDRLLSMIGDGLVGIVLSREVSRLSRTDRDWCALVELCQLSGTLLGDEEQIYDLNQIDDQLILGIKGTMSVVELNVLKMRMQSGKDAKAKRGELCFRLSAGYVYDLDKHPVKDPDLRAQQNIALVFLKFREFGCIRQMHQWFVDEEIELPVHQFVAGKLRRNWKIPQYIQVIGILKNPFYAGAYVYGRRPREKVFIDGKVVKKTGKLRKPKDCAVFIPEHHDAYISWNTYEENQQMIRDNQPRRRGNDARTSPRKGTALFVGLIRCGHCGRKIHVHYWGGNGSTARYQCKGDYDSGGAYCISFSSKEVEEAIVKRMLDAISPLGVDASVRAIEKQSSRDSEKLRSLRMKVQDLEYKTERAFVQFDESEPRNRLVTSELEQRWNRKLEELQSAQNALDRAKAAQRILTDETIEQIHQLGRRFDEAWNSSECAPVLKKQIVRAVFTEVIVTRDDQMLSFVLHWQGGVHTTVRVPRKTAKRFTRATSDEALEVIRKLAPKYVDHQIAAALNRNGLKTGTGKDWTIGRLSSLRRRHDIPTLDPKNLEGVLNLKQAISHYKVSNRTIMKLVTAKFIRNIQTIPYAPLELRIDDFESEDVQAILKHLKQTNRLILDPGVMKQQTNLFE